MNDDDPLDWDHWQLTRELARLREEFENEKKQSEWLATEATAAASERDKAVELIKQLLSDAAHTDFGDCEPWDSIMDAERFLDALEGRT